MPEILPGPILGYEALGVVARGNVQVTGAHPHRTLEMVQVSR